MTSTSLMTAKSKNGSSALRADARERPAVAGLPDVRTSGPGVRRRTSQLVKAGVDYGIGAVLLLLFAPFFALIASLIKATSPGPVFFVQERVGRSGKIFRCYKFRTMKHNSDDSVHREFSRDFIRGNGKPANGNGNGNGGSHAGPAAVYKLTRDPRITRVGALLRRTSLDELPQILNVIRGEMSLVGPRPPVVYELEHYQEWHKRRLLAKPGITGLWQVSGRSSVPFDEMVLLDLYYIDHRSTLLDLWIMARTLPVVIKGDGAY
jgi:lipopolysaccharide/colanic/teichoic acid biosynthesis glycosyltransferase